MGISLASGVPVYSGFIAGIIGGVVIPIISKSPLSVSGPAAGLTAISAAAIQQLGHIEVFFLAVSLAGIFQILLGVFRLGGFTHFIPSSVIKGMLAAIGIILISKQIPLLVGYEQPDFLSNELFNLLTFRLGFDHISALPNLSPGSLAVALLSLAFLIFWKKKLSHKLIYLPASFATVAFGSLLAVAIGHFWPEMALRSTQFVSIPENLFVEYRIPDVQSVLNTEVLKFSLIICFVATLETLLSIEAVDKLDPSNRVTPQNRELIAQGAANCVSGIVGGLPITSVIVRSSANAEAGAKTNLSAVFHGVWLLLTVSFASSWVSYIPYSVLAVILIRTGYNLVKPKMIVATYRQGREQFLPFVVTIVAILLTDLLVGVLIGIVYAIYFLIKHTYRAGFTLTVRPSGHTKHFQIDLALNVSFMNKKRFQELLDAIPPYSIVEINGANSVYIDHDILEIFQGFKSKARVKHIQVLAHGIPEVEVIEVH
jgi:MFS superfamily sulfate permease-like transporter